MIKSATANYCFVILHYKTHQDSSACIHSILDNCPYYSSIVVVDNFSNNGSIEIIEEEFKDYHNIFIIKNKENLGFARGNNVGYQFAREQLKADFILVSNNDIIIKDNFLEAVQEEYQKSNCHLIGPDIISLLDQGHQSPMQVDKLTFKDAQKLIIKYKLILLLIHLKLYKYIKPLLSKRTSSIKETEHLSRQENVKLHGAFIIYTPNYVKNEINAFNPNTFLYMEEDILYQYCLKKGYLSVYLPKATLYHKEDSSTNSLFTSNIDKQKFVLKNMIKSLRVYMSIIRR